MKHTIVKILPLLVALYTLTSCLKGDDGNFPVSPSPDAFIQLNFIQTGGTTINSGLNYFSGAALTYPSTDEADTATYSVTLEGTKLGKDLVITVKPDFTRNNDNYSKDSIVYQSMPDSLFTFLNTTAIIKAGDTKAEFKVIFYPSKVDPIQNYILPVTATSSDDKIKVSANYGNVFFHMIGNPIAGAYNWDFLRYNTQDGSGSLNSASFTGESAVFAPASPLSVKVPTGYYVQPNYLITFSNNNGVLSNFKAVIAPDEIKAAFTDNGISIVSAPTITVENNNTKFTIHYVVFNGSAYRNITDIFYQ